MKLGGEVLFNVSSMKDYGALSNRKLEEQQAGARVAVEAHKKNPGDFVLWKLSSAEEPGWESPWGRGRPGWHIECSAMSKNYLGEEFDIHGGGLDLIFPHHENEIAQSRCAHGTDVMANVWMHNGFLQVEGQKMSKSLGNFVTINELLDTKKFGQRKWPGEVLRLAMLKTHYRQPIDWTVAALEEAYRTGLTWRRMIEGKDWDKGISPDIELLDALSDDLNTHAAMMRLYQLADDAKSNESALDAFVSSAQLMGFLLSETHFSGEDEKITFDGAKIDALISARLVARAAKDWKESDRIRDELTAMRIVIQDNKDGTTSWEVKR